MITIKDVAKLANVSEGTVDRVLHNRGGVSLKTEKLIKEILKKHNYTVNPIARALSIKNKFSLYTLMPNHDKTNLFWKSPLLGVLKASQEVRAYGVEVTNYTFDQFKPSSYLNEFKTLIKSKPHAVLIAPTFIKETKEIVNELEKLDIPYAFLNIDLEGFKNILFVGQNSYAAGYVAGKLMHLSCPDQSSILVIQTRLNINNYYAFSKRIEGFNDYFTKNDIKVNIINLNFDNLKNLKEVGKNLNSLLKKEKSIKGVFVPSSRISIIVNCIDEPLMNNLNLIGFDNTEPNIKCLQENKVSFLISQKPFDQGYESIHLMTDFLIKNKTPIKKIYSPIDILTKENVIYNERDKSMFESDSI